jgi:hypothetical protein
MRSLPALRVCRGFRKFKPVLSDAEGRLLARPDAVIAAVRAAEERGDFPRFSRRVTRSGLPRASSPACRPY